MKRRFEDFVIGKNKKLSLEVREMSIQEARMSNMERRDIFRVLPIVSAGEYAKALSVYVDNSGNKAVVPPGWVVSMLEGENSVRRGLVIYRIPENEILYHHFENEVYVNKFLKPIFNQLVWIPVKLISADGTMDGQDFTEKFGRRYSEKNNFSQYYEEIDEVLSKQISSVKKYGGYYISRYSISNNNMIPQSIKCSKHWNLINFYQANSVAMSFGITKKLKSHLLYGCEYDTMTSWLNMTNSSQQCILKSYNVNECINNIYDLNDSNEEWTQEMYENSEFRVVRSGIFSNQFEFSRIPIYAHTGTEHTCFRIVICID